MSSSLGPWLKECGFHLGFRRRAKWEFRNCLPEVISPSRIMRDGVRQRADTADARRGAIAPDAFLRRELLRRQVPKQPATPADFGERTAGNTTGAKAGAANHAGRDYPRQRGIDQPHARPLPGDPALAG